MNDRYTLYGAEISYYTAKVRAYLRWKGLPYDEVVADAQVYRDIIVPGVGVRVIPVLRTPEGTLLQDSTDIIDALEQRHGSRSVYPAGAVRKLVALVLELYGDEWLLLPAMHYRWHHNRAWAQLAFGQVNAPAASPEEQRAVGEKISAPFSKAAEMLGAQAHLHSAVETSYEGLMAELDAHFAQHPALLGRAATLADFGFFGPLYAHQYRDPASGDLMRAKAPQLVRWVEQMAQAPQALAGDEEADDAIPTTLMPVLRRWAREFLPILVDTAQRTREWLDANPGQTLPRALGLHPFWLEGQQGERIVRPYSLWMLQRVTDHLRALDGADRLRAQALLHEMGADALLDMPALPRLQREGLSVRAAESASTAAVA